MCELFEFVKINHGPESGIDPAASITVFGRIRLMEEACAVRRWIELFVHCFMMIGTSAGENPVQKLGYTAVHIHVRYPDVHRW